MTKTFNHLYAKSSTGKIKEWWPEVITEENKTFLVITSGYTDGKKIISKKEIQSKNKGRSNETSPYDQACSEAQSKMNSKIDEGYVDSLEKLEAQKENCFILPMLAHSYKDRKKYLQYPAFCQPKLDGVRCLADYDPTYMSRNGKEYNTLSHLNSDVMKLLNEVGIDKLLDGEIFHPDWNFQEIIRAVKKERENITYQLQYWVYDLVDTKLTFEERFKKLSDAFIKIGIQNKDGNYHIGNIILVPTYTCMDEEWMKAHHGVFIENGFEGTILRNKTGKYVYKHRSNDLLKYKTFEDAEFKIVGGEEATGNDIGTVIFVCETTAGTRFKVRPKGSREMRKEWLTQINSIIGKNLTVKYQGVSEDNVPRFPVGIAIRDYE